LINVSALRILEQIQVKIGLLIKLLGVFSLKSKVLGYCKCILNDNIKGLMFVQVVDLMDCIKKLWFCCVMFM